MHRLSRLTRFGTLGPMYPRSFIRSHGTLQHRLRVLDAPHISYARNPEHVYKVASELQTSGLLKIRLGFADDSCGYLRDLILMRRKAGSDMFGLNQSPVPELIMLGLKL
ncbi:Taurine catabolism dioxygenase [Fusarium sp. NRRL 52700]|nr:Taurine catabolism dioxygenase [Fusarium sp. NRRL 52700]